MEEVTDLVGRIRSRGEEAGVAQYATIHAGYVNIRVMVYKGQSLEALEGMLHGVRVYPLRCLVLAHLGKREEALEILDQNVVRRPSIGTSEDETLTWQDSLCLEAAVLTGNRTAADLLLNRFSETGVCTSGIFYPTCIPRHLGGAAALLERYDEARQHYQEAVRVCTEMRFRPELALSRLQMAELLLEHYPNERAEALGLLDFSIAEFRDMKMQPSLERALRHKEILKA
jgi:tetratricopeptide (TPR) repeat protein